MSIALLAFPAAPKVNPDAVQSEKVYEDYIRKRTLGLSVCLIELWALPRSMSASFVEILKDDPNAEPGRVLMLLDKEEPPKEIKPTDSTHGSKSVPL